MACIDVIIPMYNSEQYIPGLLQCLESQKMKDFRAIFVDDGSKDGTYALLQEKLQEVSFSYLLIHQDNKGVPGARNTGIRHAQADWVTFLDSDDGLDPNYFAFLLRGVMDFEVNVGICGHQMITCPEEAVLVPDADFSSKVIDSRNCMKNYYQKWFGVWVMILNRRWLESQTLLFDEDCVYLEDVPFITQVIAAAEKVVVVDNPLYLYYKREGSLMRTPKIEKYVTALDGFHRMMLKLADMDGAAAEEFHAVGQARYYLATLRRAAILMPYPQYLALCVHIPMDQVRQQFSRLRTEQRLSAELYLISKRLFYYAMRWMTQDH